MRPAEKDSSPRSTGPAGGQFETKVGTHYVLALLANTEPLGLPGAIVDQLEFQRGITASPKNRNSAKVNPHVRLRVLTGLTRQLFFQRHTVNISDKAFQYLILSELAPDGTCAIVLDEGLLFRTNESAFVETKRKLVDECDLFAIVSLPGGVFSTAGAGVKTNLLFFTKGRKTEKIWYYDLSGVKVGKKTPLTLAHFGFTPDGTLLGESRYSWTVDFAARRTKAREEMQPLLDEAAAIRTEVVECKERLKRLKKEKTDTKKS